MNNKAYKPEQLAFAERIARAMASVPNDRRPALETVVEVLITGASIAAQQPAERSVRG